MATPLNPDGIRQWARDTNRRLSAIEATTGHGLHLPFAVRPRTEGPLTAQQLAARMVARGVDAKTAAENAAMIVG